VLRTYFNQRAAVWDETAAEKDTTKLEQMAKRLNINPGSTVLDVGTGTGIFIPLILRKIGENGHIVALDIAEKMLEKARAKGFGGNIDYLCADVTDIPLNNETFDAIVCYSTFPHFRDKPRALAEMNRVLKAGGRLFICHTSSRARINEVHRQIPAVRNDTLPGEDEMQMMLLKAGFTNIEIADDSESYLASARKAENSSYRK